jgi:hypothetical protein
VTTRRWRCCARWRQSTQTPSGRTET